MQCVLLVGGQARRIRPLTQNLPKALISILEKPFLYYQLQWLEKNGVDQVLLLIGYRGEMIRNYVREYCSQTKTKLKIDFTEEKTGEKTDEECGLKGTAGALRLALDEGKLNDRFLVMYGDSFLPIDFSKPWNAFLAADAEAMMTVYKNENHYGKSNVVMKDGRILLYDKKKSSAEMNTIDYGLSAFKKTLIEKEIPSGVKMDLADVLNKLSLENRLLGVEVFERFFEVGSFEGIRDFTEWCERL